MKLSQVSPIALAALALAGCASTGTAAPIDFPLSVQNNASGADAERFAGAFTSGAMATRAFHIAGSGEAGTVMATIDSIRPMDAAQPSRGFTYIVSWSRGGQQIGRQEDDCLADEVKACAKEAAETMYSQVYYYSRARR
jgi:hypothetical protein